MLSNPSGQIFNMQAQAIDPKIWLLWTRFVTRLFTEQYNGMCMGVSNWKSLGNYKELMESQSPGISLPSF